MGAVRLSSNTKKEIPMQRIVTRFLGLVLVAAVGLFAYTGASASDTPEIGGLTPLAPDAIQEPNSSTELFPNGEPVTPFVDDANGPAVGSGGDVGSEMPVPGFEGDVNETTVEIGSGMAVPGYEGDVTEMVVETGN